LNASTLTQMQQTVGNAAVQRFLAQRQGDGPSEIQEETANTINAKRGSGGGLDAGFAKKAGSAMGQDFSDVNVHTDSQADELSTSLGAKAFTTGSDIFFQSGQYNPGSSDGQQLLAHELTHVVQQGGAPSGGSKMTVNDPNDQYEQEADEIANQVMNQPDPALQRQDVPEEEEAMAKPDLSRQPIEEEEEMMQPKLDPALQRQDVPEDEMMAKPDPALQREEMPEDEMMTKPDPELQREEMPEEELMAKPDLSLQPVEEEEEMMQPKLDPALQRQDIPEEEEAIQEMPDSTLQRQDELPEEEF